MALLNLIHTKWVPLYAKEVSFPHYLTLCGGAMFKHQQLWVVQEEKWDFYHLTYYYILQRGLDRDDSVVLRSRSLCGLVDGWGSLYREDLDYEAVLQWLTYLKEVFVCPS
jgi:hypothetical protein